VIEVPNSRVGEGLAEPRQGVLPRRIPDHRQSFDASEVLKVEFDVRPKRRRIPAIETVHVDLHA
jgi:hypothetical protein